MTFIHDVCSKKSSKLTSDHAVKFEGSHQKAIFGSNHLKTNRVLLSPVYLFFDCCITGVTPTVGRANISYVVLHYGDIYGPRERLFAMAMVRDELFAAYFGIDYIVVYNTSSMEHHRNITIPGLSPFLCDIAACPSNNYLYVLEQFGRRLFRVDLSTNEIVEWETCTWPWGMTINSARNVLITCEGFIRELNGTTGLVMRNVSVEPQGLSFRIVETRSGTLIVNQIISPRETSSIAELTLEGRVVRRYNFEETQCGNSPRISFVVDSSGFILVAAQRNTHLQVLNPEMTTSRSLELPTNIKKHDSGLSSPMCYDESRGRLYVAELSGQKRLLVFDQVTNLGALFT